MNFGRTFNDRKAIEDWLDAGGGIEDSPYRTAGQGVRAIVHSPPAEEEPQQLPQEVKAEDDKG